MPRLLCVSESSHPCLGEGFGLVFAGLGALLVAVGESNNQVAGVKFLSTLAFAVRVECVLRDKGELG